jgi:hypothetical protein
MTSSKGFKSHYIYTDLIYDLTESLFCFSRFISKLFRHVIISYQIDKYQFADPNYIVMLEALRAH